MAITATTLAAAATNASPTVSVASATGITAPNFTAGTGITYLMIDAEVMQVTGVAGTVISVNRGFNGSLAAAHVNGANVQIGLPGDFSAQGEFLAASTTGVQTELGLNWPATLLAGSADVIAAGVAGCYVIKTAGVDAATLGVPTLAQEGNIIIITSDTAQAHTVTAPSAVFCHGLTAVHTIATFAALAGAGMILRVCNLRYHVLSQLGITFS